MMRSLPVGKLSSTFLAELLQKHCPTDAGVVVGPSIGEDAAVVDLGTSYLVAATDPVTFAIGDIGWYAVQVNANDVATMGAVPRWFLTTLLLPQRKSHRDLVQDLFDQLSRACQRMNISWIGGHTEITSGLDRPIVVGTMLGQVEKNRLVTSSGARVGDAVILTKGIAVEATALIAREREQELKVKYSKEFLDRCKAFLYKPGIGIVKDAQAAMQATRLHAMHDPTEGGLTMGLWELAEASGVGLKVNRGAIEILPETIRLCGEYGLDPLGAIASGSLLVAVSPDRSQVVLDALAKAGIAATVIGLVTSGKAVRWEDGRQLPKYARDEVAKLFEDRSGGDLK